MVDFSSLASVAHALISDNGRVVSLIRPTETPINPSMPWKIQQDEETVVSIKAVFVPPSSVRQLGLDSLGQGYTYNDLIVKADKLFMCSPGELDISQYSAVLDGSIRYGILTSQILRPKDQSILAYVWLRR